MGRRSVGGPRHLLRLGLLLCLAAGQLEAQRPRTPVPDEGSPRESATTTVVIRVRSTLGTPLLGHALVRLTSRGGSYSRTEAAVAGGEAVFPDVTPDTYLCEITAPGYLPAQEEVFVVITGHDVTVIVNLQPQRAPIAGAGPEAIPVLTPKAQGELAKALEAMRKNNLAEMGRRLRKASKMAPGHPEVEYAYGMMFLQLNEGVQARAHLEKAVRGHPGHARALAALGDALFRQQDYAGAVQALEHSLDKDPDRWQTHGLLASALYAQKEFERARAHAERAWELSGETSADVRLLLALSLDALGKAEKARAHAEAFLGEWPDDPRAATARQILDRKADASEALAPAAEVSGRAGTPLDASPVPAPPLVPAVRPEPPRPSWAPPDVDDHPPAVTREIPCSLPSVVGRAARRAQALVGSLERITATETIEHALMTPEGGVRDSEARSFHYVVSIQQFRKGALSVDEGRWGRSSFYSFSSGMAATGLAAMALVFHPLYAPDFDMACEGLGQWHGHPAWVVTFRQKPERPSRFRSYRTMNATYEVRLKGRAWLATTTGDVLRLESDLLEPVLPLRLTKDHLVIEYAPVKFKHGELRLWLPARAELYSDFRGRRYRLRHRLENFLLFSVDVAHETEQVPEPPPS